ncbi:MAG: enoyl-CoA hydratase/isomerase family protein [Phycisphaeraceae bacterium]|nr:enoyl-CoA hydratase/isomerase family protein [Phycisphaeraceae bacterium]
MSVSISYDAEIATLALARPAQRNALTPAMLDELCALAAQAQDRARSLILCGHGPAFCAGFDLRLCQQAPDGSVMRALLSGLDRAIATLRDLSCPVVVAAHGAAIAGGCALLGGADAVVTNAQAKLGYPVVRLGVSPAVSAPTLGQALPHGAARCRLLDPGLISGRRAAEIGLAHELVQTAEEVLPRARRWAELFASKPRGAMETTRRWLASIQSVPPDDRALQTSLALAGGAEERDRLGSLSL